jgi:Histidine kinase-, DNA gyrase B-, and HSP90-like ATPase
MDEREVKLSQDHLQRQSRVSPERAMEELIWNGLDAGGPSVQVIFESNNLEAVVAVEIVDHGSGIDYADLDRAFGTLGRSLKNERRVTHDGRALHGSEGRGRFKALVLGNYAKWTTIFRNNGDFINYTIDMRRGTQDKYIVSAPIKASVRSTGTIVRIDELIKGQSLISEKTKQSLTQRLALYLTRYPVTVQYDSQPIDPQSVIKHREHRDIEVLDDSGESLASSLDVLEWTFETQPKILICDADGFAWHELPARVPSHGMPFTAFVSCAKAREWNEAGRFILDELDKDIAKVVSTVRQALSDYLRSRLAEQAGDLVKQWKDEKIYPYSEDDPQSSIQKAERQVFDIVASRVHLYHPTFGRGELTARQFTLHLVRQALESNPGSLKRILEEVLRLPKAEQDDLADLFERTNLRAIVSAATVVDDRLQAIEGFDHILFDPDWRKTLLERTQLHRLLVRHLWIFGDEYTLDADDESVRVVLDRHKKILGRNEIAPSLDVSSIDREDLIPDLMLSRRFARDAKLVEHVVIELKRPSVKLGDTEISQIKTYANAITREAQFSREQTQWTFFLIGNDFDDFAETEARGDDRPYGRLRKQGNHTIWMKRWADVLHDARSRYAFFRDKLELEVSGSSGLQYLQDHYSSLMSGRGLTKKQEKALEDGATQGA